MQEHQLPVQIAGFLTEMAGQLHSASTFCWLHKRFDKQFFKFCNGGGGGVGPEDGGPGGAAGHLRQARHTQAPPPQHLPGPLRGQGRGR